MGRMDSKIDSLVLDLVKNDNTAEKKAIADQIKAMGYKKGVYPASINDFYLARGKGEVAPA